MKVFNLLTGKTKTNYYNSQEFYKKHPDLAPRNVYLSQGRIIKMEDVKKHLDNICKETFSEKCTRYLNNIKSLFKKTR